MRNLSLSTVFVVARSATVFVAARQFACGEAVRLTDEQSEELSQRERRKRPSANSSLIYFSPKTNPEKSSLEITRHCACGYVAANFFGHLAFFAFSGFHLNSYAEI